MSAMKNAPSNAAPRKTRGRQITYADVEQMIAATETNPDFSVPLLYFSREMRSFVRATGTLRKTHDGYATPIRWREGRGAPETVIGLKVNLNIGTEFGTSVSAPLVTTSEADSRGQGYGKSSVGSLELLIEDENGDRDVELVGVYGLTVNAGLIVQGDDLDPDEVVAEIEQVLATHFAERGKDVRAKARPVADFRVNVYSLDMERLLAMNVLVSEAYRFADGVAFTTVRADTDPATAAVARSEA